MEKDKDQRKVAIFLHYLGPDSLPIFSSFNIEMDTVILQDVIDKLEEFCSPKKNIAMERHNFFTRKQIIGESIKNLLQILKIKANHVNLERCKVA